MPDCIPICKLPQSLYALWTPFPPLPFPFPNLPSEPEPIIHPLPKSWELFAACAFRTFHLICMDRADVVRKTDDLELPQCLPLESPWIPARSPPDPLLMQLLCELLLLWLRKKDASHHHNQLPWRLLLLQL